MSITWPILSFFLGLILGHWLSLGRERRKEFNEKAEALFVTIDSERKRPNFRQPNLNRTDVAVFRRYLPRWRARAFDEAFVAYERTKFDGYIRQPGGGDIRWKETPDHTAAIAKLLTFLKHR